MADQGSDDRTEQPTGHRLEEAKNKGSVAKSQEFNSVAVLLAGLIGINTTSGMLYKNINEFFVTSYRESSFMELTIQSFPGQVLDFMRFFGAIILPILIIISIAALASNIGQVGFMIAKKALKPDFKKLSPMSGIKRMFSSKSLVEMLKGILKISILALISWSVISDHDTEYLMLPNRSIGEILGFLGSMIYELVLKAGIALLIMAIGDFAYQRYSHIKSLKMTKQEVKDEHKQYEGDPKLKGRIRGKQMEVARQRMMQDIPEATVVVTNPTHIAIALKYEPENKSDAPKVIAKGKEKLAQKIKDIARDNDVPVVENKPLARSLFEVCEIGDEIPVEFYQTVAELLTQVYQSNESKIPLIGELNG